MYTPKKLSIKNIISHVNSEYIFQNGKAIVVVGINNDNPSQRNNGAGKSALIESLALAFTGTSIRDVKVKELITHGAKQGSVRLELLNTITNKTMVIERTIYSGTKSAECSIYIDDEPVKLPDVNTYNKFIFEQIGLSKEDFFNFYLIVQANYSAFLTVGDTKKKEIINRFSGADSIDNVFQYIKADVDIIQQDIDNYTKIIQQNTAYIDVYDKDIEQLQMKIGNIEQMQHQHIQHIQQQIDTQVQLNVNNQNKLAQSNANIKQYEQQIKHIEQTSSIDEFKANLQQLQNEQIDKQNRINQLQIDVKNVVKKYDTVVNSIKQDESNVREQIAQLKSQLNECEQFESELNKLIQDSIECPNCHHIFNYKQQDIDISIAQENLQQIKQDIDNIISEISQLTHYIDVELAQSKQKVNSDIINEQNQLRKQISLLNDELVNINNNITQINNNINNITTQLNSLKNSITFENNNIVSINKNIEHINNNIEQLQKQKQQPVNFDFEQQIEQKQQQKQQCIQIIEQNNKKLDEINKKYLEVGQWETNFKNFKSYVANQSIKNIQDFTNLYLTQMGSDLSIVIDGFSVLSNGKIKEQIDVQVLRGGFNQGSYGSFSGGERGRIDICVILAIQQLINLNCTNGGLDLLICDEILDQIDTLGLESIINSLQSLHKTIMIVSQNDINSLKQYTLTIEKTNKISSFVNN